MTDRADIDQQGELPGLERPIGRYIALEGVEGCGKSTAARLLSDDLDAVLTREHGGTPIGQLIRAIVADPNHTGLDDRAEALLIAGDRAQHLAEVVQPALDLGRHVVSDRSVYSSLAYQGYGRGLDLDMVRNVNNWALGGRWPDIVVFLEVSPVVQAARLKNRNLDRFERAGEAFFERVIDGFRTMAADDPDRWITVSGDGSPMEVHAVILAAVKERL
jgi:dTMP kinase